MKDGAEKTVQPARWLAMNLLEYEFGLPHCGSEEYT